MSAHAGALYALVRYQEDYPDAGNLKGIRQLAGFLNRQVIQLPHVPDALTVKPNPLKSKIAATTGERLSSSASTLCALATLEHLQPGSIATNTLRGLGHFLRLEEQQSGAFSSAAGTQPTHANPLATFSPGEAELAFLCLSSISDDPEWLIGAEAALQHGAALRAEGETPHQDPWSLIAASKYLKSRDSMMDPEMRKLLQEDARRFCNARLRQLDRLPEAVREAGALTPSASTSNTSLVLAGLVAALEILPENEQPIREHTRRACDRAIQFLVGVQLSSGPNQGAFPRIPAIARPGLVSEILEDPTVHIIEAQNALFALMLYDRVLGTGWF
jgi:hypothetical protein